MRENKQGKAIGEIIARAWSDPAFKARLLKDTKTVLYEQGVDLPSGTNVRVVENTDELVHFVLPARPADATAAFPHREFVLGCNCWQGEAWN